VTAVKKCRTTRKLNTAIQIRQWRSFLPIAWINRKQS